MKKFVLIALIATSLAGSAQALIVGANVGYLLDSKEAYGTVRIGYQFKTETSIAHSIEAEVGGTSDTEDGVSVRLMPVTLNYRAELAVSDKISWYGGFGAGSAQTMVNYWVYHLNEWSFTAQGFAGVGFRVSKAATINLGARYIWIDDISVNGFNVPVGDDVSLELGISVKF